MFSHCTHTRNEWSEFFSTNESQLLVQRKKKNKACWCWSSRMQNGRLKYNTVRISKTSASSIENKMQSKGRNGSHLMVYQLINLTWQSAFFSLPHVYLDVIIANFLGAQQVYSRLRFYFHKKVSIHWREKSKSIRIFIQTNYSLSNERRFNASSTSWTLG